MSRGAQIDRQWELAHHLAADEAGTPLDALASHFGVDEKTIQRDLADLRAAGFPLGYEEREFNKRYWKLPADYLRLGLFRLELDEALALHLAAQLLRPLHGTLVGDGFERFIHNTLHKLIRPSALEYFRALHDVVLVRAAGETDHSEHGEQTRQIAQAVREHRTLRIRYRALWAGHERDRLFDPYGLVYFNGSLYVVGRQHGGPADGSTQGEPGREVDASGGPDGPAIRTYKVTRIEHVTMTAFSFTLPADFCIERQFQDAFGITRTADPPRDVVVQFTGRTAQNVAETMWHESQQMQWLPAADGKEPDTLLVRFRLAGFAELKRWVLRYGSAAQVIEPKDLRDEIAAELREAVGRYEARPSA